MHNNLFKGIEKTVFPILVPRNEGVDVSWIFICFSFESLCSSWRRLLPMIMLLKEILFSFPVWSSMIICSLFASTLLCSVDWEISTEITELLDVLGVLHCAYLELIKYIFLLKKQRTI